MRIQALLFLLVALSARGMDINRNMCYSSTENVQVCDESTNFGYELEWYSVPDGELKTEAQLKFIAKVTRLPSPALAEGEKPSTDIVPIDEAFVLVCREGAMDCSPVHTFQVPEFLLHKLSIEGAFEFEHTEEGVDAETYKLKSFEFASHVAERLQIVFSIKLSNGRYIAIHVDRDVSNGATQVVPLVDTARCMFENRFELQIANAPNGDGLAFSLVPGEGEPPPELDHYRIAIKQYGDLRSVQTNVDEEEWFVGASDSVDKNYVAGNLVNFPLPFTDKELGFGGANSILGRALVLLDTRTGLGVRECLPTSHTTLIDVDETTNEASTNAQVANAASLVCYFKDSGSVVVLEQAPYGSVLVRFTLSVAMRAVRQFKSELVIIPANNTLLSGTQHGLQVEWHDLQVGSALTFAGEKCILSRTDQSTFIQREFPGLTPLVANKNEEAALITTASCVFPQLGQLVFFRHNVNGTVRMEYSLLTQRASSNITELGFHRYGIALSPHLDANPIEFTWQMPQASSNAKIASGVVTWKALELDRLVGRLVKADKHNFCLVRADATSLHYARTVPTPTPTTIKAAHCAFQDSTTTWAVALWFKQVGVNEQIQVKILVDKHGTEEDQFHVRVVGTSTTETLMTFTSPANLHLDTLLQGTTTMRNIEELYGMELELVSTSRSSSSNSNNASQAVLWWGSCIVGIVETPETKPPTTSSKGTAQATERPTIPMVETEPPVLAVPIINPDSTSAGAAEASTIPLIMLAILGVVGCAMYFTCNKLSNNADEYQAQQDIGAHDEADLEQPPVAKERTF